METIYNQREKMTDFIRDNKQNFQDKLLSEAVNVASKINDILETGNIDLLKNAQKLALYVVEQKEEPLIAFAQQEGVAWAEHSLTLAFKLEWVQSIRRTLWHFLYQYDRINNQFNSREEFYALEKRINDKIDQFLNTFLISYSKYKDELIASQRELVEHLSVPVIPLSQSIAVLPLIGMIDTYRIQTIEEKVLTAISDLKIQTLIIDLSGAANMEMHVIDHFQKILTGISMMGCKAILTGLRADLVRTMIQSGISFEEKAETTGTLQQTLKEYLELHQM
ncbi:MULTISPECIES: STAS domain-containing protein [Priestia]|jgi:rsbT co-antagonist protein RsbR|uniref:STAS domain-containing protein n=1 Tax=Priestia TaxID=2800373 RepID=UPI001EBA9FB2|nr:MULTISPECIES: STAS domain-containing protein [Priestia]MBY0094779.1 STAS domain-containing protein [Priestia aryabhattai]MBY0099751.1 STAS domain-containing protein [Priestia aryabhattai]MCM3098008.1 STAS domain-containing protein [Priestia megaterium]MCM3304198.1 STAS domain-containing protein [Priestia megaterium]MED4026296.1 STAS domain-containing protein [Priestia megaterium]